MAEITQIDLGLVVGDTGATGATGPTGPQGPGATISVGSVTTTTYGNPAQVTNSGTATDAVLDFVIPQGAPGEEVTDVSSLTLNSITETAASFPVPAVGDVMSVVMGKVKKFFADTVAALNTKLNKSNVVNDLTYTTEGYALDARAGKTLKTQIDSLNDSFSGIGSQSGNNLTSKTVASGTWVTIDTLNVAKSGSYIITGDIDFASSSNGIRILLIDSEETSSNNANNSVLAQGRATLTKCRIVSLTANSTIYLRAYHTNGSDLTCSGRIRAIFI